MKIIAPNNLTEIPPCAATLGFFDGVHAGHRFLISELNRLANERNLKSAVITFAEHPRKVLHNEFQPLLLNTTDEKLEQLSTTGIDFCFVLEFDTKLAEMSARDFLEQVLLLKFNVKMLLVGHDHRFGHNRSEGYAEYNTYGKTLGMEIIRAERFSTSEDYHISSSDIRNALKNGDINHANLLLTYPYSLSGKVVSGYKIGQTIGFPTANLQPENPEKLIPSNGVYAVTIQTEDDLYDGMLNIGCRPTINNGETISIEVNIFNFDQNLYNQRITIRFIQRIRNEIQFQGIDALIEQLKRDKQTVEDIFIKMRK